MLRQKCQVCYSLWQEGWSCFQFLIVLSTQRLNASDKWNIFLSDLLHLWYLCCSIINLRNKQLYMYLLFLWEKTHNNNNCNYGPYMNTCEDCSGLVSTSDSSRYGSRGGNCSAKKQTNKRNQLGLKNTRWNSFKHQNF